MKYVFHPEALTEYAEAVQYYTQQRTEVAQAFIDAVLKVQSTESRRRRPAGL